MRKFKLMPFALLAAVFGLSACTLPSWLSWLPFGQKEEKDDDKKEDKKGKSFSFPDGVSYFAEEGFADVEIPAYKCASSSATMTQPDVQNYPTAYIIKGSSATEMETYLDTLEEKGWTIFEEGEGYAADLYEVEEEGARTPEIYVADFSEAETAAYKGILVQFLIYEVPTSVAAFPLEDVNSYLTNTQWAQYYGFTLSQAEADAITALATKFVFQSGSDSSGYPMAMVAMTAESDISSQVLSIIEATINAAGFTYDSDYDAYFNQYYWKVYAQYDEGVTYLVFN